MYQFCIILGFTFFCGCTPAAEQPVKSKVMSKQVQMITLYELQGFRNMEQNVTSTFYLLTAGTIQKINEERSPQGKLLKSDTTATVPSSTITQKNIQELIPKKYVDGPNHQNFGAPNAADGGGWGISIFKPDGKEVTLLFDHDEKNVPADLRHMYAMYAEVKTRL